MKGLRSVVALLLGLGAWGAHAADIDSVQLLDQSQFRLLSEDLGAALSYKPLTPAEPLGLTGFDIGVAVTGTKLRNTAVFDRATRSGNFPDYVPVPTLRAYKGLPFGIDVGLMAGMVPNSNVRFYGGELRYALLSGNVALPAIAIRGSYTKLSGVSQLDFDTKGIDLSISKGVLNFTPYGGVGHVWVSSTPNGVAGLNKETFGLNKVFVGINFNMLLMNLAVEADRTGDATSFGVKLGVRF
ncbi:MAG: hypothetical protein GC151_15295 [Betaproteobacteria bacterium]|nr:hypothetical protein [Betaproteobacteria bacterium]